jgi:AMP nucleosidase
MTEMPKIESPRTAAPEAFTDPRAAADRLEALYAEATGFLCGGFEDLLAGRSGPRRLRAFYPQVAITTTSFAHIDSRLSFGHVPTPGHYAATVTRPDLFRDYLVQQLGLLLKNHNVPVIVGPSQTPIPLHFAFPDGIARSTLVVARNSLAARS